MFRVSFASFMVSSRAAGVNQGEPVRDSLRSGYPEKHT